jgi:ferredoxin-NADP reductase
VSNEGGDSPSHWREALIDRVVRRTPHVVSVFLRVPLGPFEAGQHVDVRLTAPDGYQAQRSYSIASAPGAPEIELAIERLDDGEVSPYFFDVAAAGDAIELRGPIGGHFVWRASDGGPLLLLGGGSGVVPLMSILRHRAAAAPDTKALLAYSARTWDDVIFRDELVDQAARDAHFRLVLATTRGVSPRGEDFGRRFDRKALREILGRWGEMPRHAYVCGSTPFVETVTSDLVAEGVPPGRVRAERYGG